MACGDGPIDAVFLAIEELTGFSVACRDFRVHSVTVGKDAQGEVLVEVEHEGQFFRGRGVSTDSVEASAKAFLGAINRIAAGGAQSRGVRVTWGLSRFSSDENGTVPFRGPWGTGAASVLYRRPSGGIGRRSGF